MMMPPLKVIQRALINVFIIACISSWLLMTAMPSKLQAYSLEFAQPCFYRLGLLLLFNMFAPDVPQSNHVIEGDITFADGTHRIWKFKSQADYKDNLWLHQIKIREAALTSWLWRPDGYREMKLAAARYIARSSASPAKLPVAVDLFDYSCPILLPGATQQASITRQHILHYMVRDEDLQ